MGTGKNGRCLNTKSAKNSSGSLNNQLPPNDAQLKHIFRNSEGHLTYTPENLKLIETVVNNPAYNYGTDARGLTWYSKINSDGSQTWASVRNGVVQNAGKNSSPHIWDPETGFSRNIKKKNKSSNDWRNKK